MHKMSRRWWVVFLLFTGTFINAIDRASLSTAAPVMMKEMGLDAAKMGFVLSAFFWFYMLMNIPAGQLADRYGAKVVMGWAAFLWSACSALIGRANGFWQLIALRLGVGAGESASFPVNAKIVNHQFEPHERGMVVGFYSCGLRIGLAAAPVMVAALIARWSWHFAFYATGLGSLAWVVLWFFTYPSEKVETPAEPQMPEKSSVAWLALLRNRTVLGLVLCKFFQDYLFYLFVTWLPGYLVLNRGFSILKMGWFASLPWIAGSIAQPLAGFVSDSLIRRGKSVTFARKSIIITMQILAASVIAAGYTKDAMTAVWLLTFSVAVESAATAILWTTCTDIAPKSCAGSLAGLMNSAGALAGILAPTVTGFLAQSAGGFQLALLVGGCMVVIAAVAIGFVVGEIKTIASPIPVFAGK